MDKSSSDLASTAEHLRFGSEHSTCNECKITKPLTEFHKRLDNYNKRCKECVCRAERLRYTIRGIDNGTYQCYDVGLDEIPQELSLPELKALMKQHNITIKPHSNKPDIVEVLKQQGILPSNHVSGLRRAPPLRGSSPAPPAVKPTVECSSIACGAAGINVEGIILPNRTLDNDDIDMAVKQLNIPYYRGWYCLIHFLSNHIELNVVY